MTPSLITLCVFLFCFGVMCGLLAGIIYESRYGETAQTAEDRHRIILRMIPRLHEHFSADYIYWELIQNDREPGKRPTYPERRRSRVEAPSIPDGGPR